MTRRQSGVLLALILSAGASVHPSVLLPASLDELTAGADAVVYARVAAIEVQQAPGTRRVERIVTIDVVRALKGNWTGSVRLRVPGGTLGRFRTVVPGAPELAPGEEAVLFLRASGTRLPVVFGLNQGLFRVDADPATGRRLVRAAAGSPAGEPIRRGDPGRQLATLEQFEDRVAALVLAHRARPERR